MSNSTDESLPTPDSKPMTPSQEEKWRRARELWSKLFTETAQPGMTLGGTPIESGISMQGATLDSEQRANTGLSTPGATLDAEGKEKDGLSISGATVESRAADQKTPGVFPEEDYASRLMRTISKPGRTDFDIQNLLAAGGMGEVFFALQVGLDRVVAFKRPKPGLLQSPTKLAAFLREGTVTGELEHPNIIPIYQNGVDDNGLPYYAMKLIRGIEWRYLLHPELAAERHIDFSKNVSAKSGTMGLQEHIDIFLKVCDAVAFAHSKRILHRDLKPENVMVGDYGEVQVMDWGLAIDISDHDPSSTKAVSRSRIRGPAGTPAYMAPEMALGEVEKIGAPTDVYLLGAILYEVLTGVPPHDAKDINQTLYQAAVNEIIPLEHRGNNIPAGLSQIAVKALATNPSARYANVTELQEAVREYLRHAQSIKISDKAKAGLDAILVETTLSLTEAQASKRYVRFAEIVAAFRQALELWDGNAQAKRGLVVGLATFVEAALNGEDLGLAQAQLRELEEVTSEVDVKVIELTNKWNQLDRARRERKRNFYAAVSFAAALLVILIVGGLISYQKIKEQRDIAREERSKAVEQKNEADKARKEAETQRGIAVEQKSQADVARKEAETQRGIAVEQKNQADIARKEAETQRGIAVEQKNQADVARKDAEEQRGIAVEQKNEADKARKDAEEQRNYALQQKEEAFKREKESRTNLARIDIQEADTLINSERDYPRAASSLVKAMKILNELDVTEPKTMLAQIFHTSPLLALDISMTSPPQQVCFLSDTSLPAALLEDGRILLDEKELASPVRGVSGASRFASFNGGFIVLDSDGNLYRNGEKFQPAGLHDSPILSIAADGSGKRLAIGMLNGSLCVYDASDVSKPVFIVTAHRLGVDSIIFRPHSDEIITAASDGRLKVFDAKGRILREVRAHTGYVACLAADLSGVFAATAGQDGVVKVWNLEKLTEQATLLGHRAEVGALAFHPSRPLLASQGWDGTLRLWDYRRGENPKVATLSIQKTTGILSLDFSPDGRFLASLAENNRVKIWDVRDRISATPSEIVSSRMKFNAVFFTHLGETVLSGSEGYCLFKPDGDLKTENQPLDAKIICPVGVDKTLVVRSDGVLTWWNDKPFQRAKTPAISADRNGSVLTICYKDGTIYWADLAQPFKLEAAGSMSNVLGALVSSDGKTTVAWDAAGRIICGQPGHMTPVNLASPVAVRQAAFTGNSNIVLLLDANNELIGLDVNTRVAARSKLTPNSNVTAISVDPSARWLATATADGEIILHDLKFNRSSAMVTGLGQKATRLAFDPESRTLWAILEDASVRSYQIPSSDSIDNDTELLEKEILTKFDSIIHPSDL